MRWAETNGRITVLELHREITERGFNGSYTILADWIRYSLTATDSVPPALAPPSVRQVTGWLTRHPATLDLDEQQSRKAVLARCPELATAAALISEFAEMMSTLAGEQLPTWITNATAAALPGTSTFAAGLETDLAAVTAGMTTHWHSGPVEGAANRIKMLKRQMFGRAGFPLLRQRVLLA
ncbi:transposase [Streptomyces sp. NPDC090445]|uniref:transposase n=1 Tax=Streptomyces sp. NPDC090445 TaxID=3365963 RepID=UPI003806DDA1